MSLQLPNVPCSPEEPEAYVRSGRTPRFTRTGRCSAFVCRLWPGLCRRITQVGQAIFRFDPEGLEFQTAFLALALGSWWLLGYGQPSFKSTNFGALLLRLWPAPVWASLFLLLGIAQMVASHRNWMGARCLCAMSGFWLWFFVTALMALGELPGPSISVFPIIALSEAWVYLRLRAHSDGGSCEKNSSSSTKDFIPRT